jgi:hypothetical protein
VIEPPCPSEFAHRVIFVLGGNRSGTTWLVQLFGSHPEIAALDAESHMFRGLSDLWANGHRVDGEGLPGFLSPEELAAAARQFCDRLFVAERERHAPWASWFVEKSPTTVHHVPLLAATYPDGWCVHIVRDGRDVARSMSLAPFGPETPVTAAQGWARAVDEVRRDSWLLSRYRMVRYEDLVADPIGGMTDLYDWMGLPVDDDVIEGIAELADREVSRYETGPVGPGKWRRMPSADIRDIEQSVGYLLGELGYTD